MTITLNFQKRKKSKHLITISHAQHISNIENSIQTNIKPFWKYVNSLKESNNAISNCVNYNDKSSDISEPVQLFTDNFSSVYLPDLPEFNGEIALLTNGSNNDLNLSTLAIDLHEIVDYLNPLNFNRKINLFPLLGLILSLGQLSDHRTISHILIILNIFIINF